MKRNYPCMCGHGLYLHVHSSKAFKQYSRRLLDSDVFCNFCLCVEFVPDNLKFLQEKYERKLSM